MALIAVAPLRAYPEKDPLARIQTAFASASRRQSAMKRVAE